MNCDRCDKLCILAEKNSKRRYREPKEATRFYILHFKFSHRQLVQSCVEHRPHKSNYVGVEIEEIEPNEYIILKVMEQ
jgi:hypothetical protein